MIYPVSLTYTHMLNSIRYWYSHQFPISSSSQWSQPLIFDLRQDQFCIRRIGRTHRLPPAVWDSYVLRAQFCECQNIIATMDDVGVGTPTHINVYYIYIILYVIYNVGKTIIHKLPMTGNCNHTTYKEWWWLGDCLFLFYPHYYYPLVI